MKEVKLIITIKPKIPTNRSLEAEKRNNDWLLKQVVKVAEREIKLPGTKKLQS